MLLSENAAKLVQGRYIAQRWAEPYLPKKEDARTSEEVAAEVLKNTGLKQR